MPADRLLALVPSAGEKLAKKDSAALARLLTAIDVGMEPDVRFGGPTLSAGQSVVLYRLDVGAGDAPSAAHAAAAALLHVAAAVAAADGTVTVEEERALAGHLANAPELDAHDRARLAAHLEWLIASRPTLRGIKARVAQLRDRQRDDIAAALIAIAGADGYISPEEVRVLTKIFDALGLEEASLYTQLHALAASPGAGPVTVRPAQAGDPEFQLPSAPAAGEVHVDRAVIEAKLTETAVVSTLLAAVFEEDVPATPPPPATGPSGLDESHMRLAQCLAERPLWERAEVEALAGELDLMPDGGSTP